MSAFRSAPSVVRRVLVRRPWIYWLVVAVCTVAVAAEVLERVDRIEAARAAWGDTRRVLVADHDAAPGDPLAMSARDLPVAIVPASALDASGDGRHVARQHVAAGEIVTERDVAPLSRGALALVPAGWLAVPVVESPASGAQVGDRVRIVSDGLVLAGEALVVGFHDDVTLIAVPADVAPMVPLAADSGSLAVLLVP